MDMRRFLKHLFAPPALTRRRFSSGVSQGIAKAIASAEQLSSGEIRLAVETALPLRDLWSGKSPRDRAEEVFAHLGVWDTELRNGVLIYVLMADRDVEIVADRGAAARISLTEWESVCRLIEGHFRAGRFEEGAVAGVGEVGRLLEREFSARPDSGRQDRDELPNQPTLL
jgi:uncharacterized membrane protein